MKPLIKILCLSMLWFSCENPAEPEPYYILGPLELELDLFPTIVTYHSPFGQAVIGKKIDEHFTLEIKGKETKFTIKSIECLIIFKFLIKYFKLSIFSLLHKSQLFK